MLCIHLMRSSFIKHLATLVIIPHRLVYKNNQSPISIQNKQSSKYKEHLGVLKKDKDKSNLERPINKNRKRLLNIRRLEIIFYKFCKNIHQFKIFRFQAQENLHKANYLILNTNK